MFSVPTLSSWMTKKLKRFCSATGILEFGPAAPAKSDRKQSRLHYIKRQPGPRTRLHPLPRQTTAKGLYISG